MTPESFSAPIMPTPQRFDTLTSARGIAAMVVVLHHWLPLAPPLPPAVIDILKNGDLAVDLFFVLSGYVIAHVHLVALASPDRHALANFYQRRFARIYPLHLFVLVAYLLLPIVMLTTGRQVPERYDVGYFAMSLLLVQNWGFTDALRWNVPAWSISTETAAYLIFPVIAIVIHRVQRAAVLLLMGIAAVIALALAYRLWGHGGIGTSIAHLGLPRCLTGFFAGVLLYRLHTLYPTLCRMHGRYRRFGMLTLVTGALIWSLHKGGAADYWYVTTSCVVIVHALLVLPRSLEALLTIRPFVWLGEISFSVYMLHYLLRDGIKLVLPDIMVSGSWLMLTIYLTLLLALSHATWRWIEGPGQRRLTNSLSRYSRQGTGATEHAP